MDKELKWVGVSGMAGITESDGEAESVVMEPTDEYLDELADRLNREWQRAKRRVKREPSVWAGGDVGDCETIVLSDGEEEGGGDELESGGELETDVDEIWEGLSEAKGMAREVVKGMEDPPDGLRRLKKVVIRTRRRYRTLMGRLRETRSPSVGSRGSLETVREAIRQVQCVDASVQVTLNRECGRGEELDVESEGEAAGGEEPVSNRPKEAVCGWKSREL